MRLKRHPLEAFIFTSEEQYENKFSYCPSAVKTKSLILFIFAVMLCIIAVLRKFRAYSPDMHKFCNTAYC